MPVRGLPLNRYVFYLLPGLREQARALTTFAGKKMDVTKARVAIVSPDSAITQSIAGTIEEEARKARWTVVETKFYSRDGFTATEYVEQLNRKGVDTVFFLGAGPEAAAFMKAVDATGSTPSIYMLGTLAGGSILNVVTMKLKDHTFLAFPTVPTDVSEAGATEYKAFLQRNKLTSNHSAAQASAIAAARILVTALERCGKDLTRERLITALESFREYDTGLTPKITFSPNRRIGALGAYVITVDPEKKLFPATVEWVAVE